MFTRTLILTALIAFGTLLVPTLALANHICTGDTDAQPNIDFAAGHACITSGAAGGGNLNTIPGLVARVNAVLNTIVPFLIGIAVFIVIWGVFNYVATASDEEKRVEARQYIIWGVILIFCMLSVWGFVNILVNSFSLSKRAPTSLPTLPPIPGAKI